MVLDVLEDGPKLSRLFAGVEEGVPPCRTGEDRHPQRPYIRVVAVLLTQESLNGHVTDTAHERLANFVALHLSEHEWRNKREDKNSNQKEYA